MSDRRLPDKAIDLIDEAASRNRVRLESVPEEIDTLNRRKLQLQIEQSALRREDDLESLNRLRRIEEELGSVEGEIELARSEWEKERELLEDRQEAQAQIDRVKTEMEAAERDQDYEKLARSEEHTSELQSRGHLVCRLLLEKKRAVRSNRY